MSYRTLALLSAVRNPFRLDIVFSGPCAILFDPEHGYPDVNPVGGPLPQGAGTRKTRRSPGALRFCVRIVSIAGSAHRLPWVDRSPVTHDAPVLADTAI